MAARMRVLNEVLSSLVRPPPRISMSYSHPFGYLNRPSLKRYSIAPCTISARGEYNFVYHKAPGQSENTLPGARGRTTSPWRTGQGRPRHRR